MTDELTEVKEVPTDRWGRLMIPEETSIAEIIKIVRRKFSEMVPGFRFEQIVVEGPSPHSSDPQGTLFISRRKVIRFREDRAECKVSPYWSIAQILETAVTKPDHDLAKMRLVVPYGTLNELAIVCVEE